MSLSVPDFNNTIALFAPNPKRQRETKGVVTKEKKRKMKAVRTFAHIGLGFSIAIVLTGTIQFSSDVGNLPHGSSSSSIVFCDTNNAVHSQHRAVTSSDRNNVNEEETFHNASSENKNNDDRRRQGPFAMPVIGERYSIFQPYYDMPINNKDPQMFGSPQDFIKIYDKHLKWVNPMLHKVEEAYHSKLGTSKGKESLSSSSTIATTTKQYAKYVYLEMLKGMISATSFNDAELSLVPSLAKRDDAKLTLRKLDPQIRKVGYDWTYLGDTMTGWERLDNVRDLLMSAIQNNVPGDYIETGVWRGGSSIFAKAVITAYEAEEEEYSSRRVSYVCDSFHGLPPGEKKLDVGDTDIWDNVPYLEVPSEVVANNFIKYGLLDSNVVFAKGFFNETMPPLSKRIQKLAIMRLDGDMYESTVDVLYHLYDKLSIGGYVIMDDWGGFPSKVACEDFFAVHGIQPNIIPIDDLSIYWQKTEHVSIQYWRYEQSKFKLSEGENNNGIEIAALAPVPTSTTTTPTAFPNNCNAACYLENYEDLKVEFGTDEAKAIQHYISNGVSEGRDCRCKVVTTNVKLSLERYLTDGEQLYFDVASSLVPVTDKIIEHKYQVMYGKFLLPYYHQNQSLKMLEIGLGCDMNYGPGASVALHKTLFPKAEIWEAEYSSECVARYKNKSMLAGINTLVGDQGDPIVLERWIDESGGGNFDVVIDDGGHQNCQIWTSFQKLWPTLKPGGLYFIEDMQVAKTDEYRAYSNPTCDGNTTTVPDKLKEFVDDLIYETTNDVHQNADVRGGEDIEFIFCQSEACVLGKQVTS